MVDLTKEELLELVSMARADMQNYKDLYDALILRVRNERDMAYILLDEIEDCFGEDWVGGAALLADQVCSVLAKRNRNQT